MKNTYLLKDIKINTNSEQHRTATHKYHGELYAGDYYPTKKAAWRAAVVALLEIKELP